MKKQLHYARRKSALLACTMYIFSQMFCDEKWPTKSLNTKQKQSLHNKTFIRSILKDKHYN